MHRLDFLFSLPVREGDQYKSLVFLVVHILIYLHLGFVFFGSFLFFFLSRTYPSLRLSDSGSSVIYTGGIG